MLLDVGFPGAVEPELDDQIVLLSHVHHDHSGGLVDAGLRSLPVMASEGTTRSLLRPSGFSVEEASQRFDVMAPDCERQLGALSVCSYPVPHCPGAAGFRIADDQTALYFPGDVVLRTSRHDFVSDLVERVSSDPVMRRVVLLDATMAGRPQGASGKDAALALLSAAPGTTDFVVLADDYSQLLYAYLDLFFAVQQSEVHGHVAFVLDGGVRRLARLLHDAFIDRRLAQLDPLIAGQYGARMSAWGESRWLFWLDHLHRPVEAPRRIWLVGTGNLSRVPPNAAGVTIGRTEPSALSGRPSLAVDTTPWTQHSSGPMVADAVRTLIDHAAVLLFHAPSRRLQQFIRNEALIDCSPLTAEPWALHVST
jgi:hypothetical protein